MTCKKLRNKLSTYLDGELKESQRRTVQSHLEECRECCRQLQQFEGISILMRNLPPKEVSDRLEREILRKTTLSQARFKKKLIDLRIFWQNFMPNLEKTFIAAAVLVTVVGSFLYLWSFSSRPEIPINYFEKEYVHSQGMSPFSGELTMLISLESEQNAKER